jgi:hypothetical protein
MPTLVHLIGEVGEPLRLPDTYGEVIKAFKGRDIAVFGEDGSRVAIFKTGVAYIQETSESVPLAT